MRIRSIKPEFWRSEDIDSMDWYTRLVFIGIWSYVDDNGVGVYRVSSIVADLFAHDFSLDPNETLRRVNEALNVLESGGQIARYSVGGKGYIHVTNWESHQRVPNPNKPRYPLPTCENVEPTETLISSDVETNEGLRTGTGEQGNRGTEEQRIKEPPSAEPMDPPQPSFLFEQFWDKYPRKVGRQDAQRAWDKARRKVNPAVIQAAVQRMATDPNLPETQFIPHPATWLNRGGWDDAPYPPPTNGRPKTSTTDDRVSHGLSMAQRYAEQEAREEQQRLEIAQ